MRLKFREVQAPLPEMRVWLAIRGCHSFVIVLEEKMGEKFEGWTGYSLSYRQLDGGKVETEAGVYPSWDKVLAAADALAERVGSDVVQDRGAS